jgi:hypothetical protein
MRLLHGAAVATAALLLAATFAPAQSLSDAAAKEKERRKSVPKPAKVVTEEDLRSAGGTVSSTSTPDSTPAAGGDAKPAEGQAGKEGASAKKEKSEDELRAEAQTAWRKKLDAANAEMSQAQGLVTQIQAELNDTSGGVYTPRRAGLQTQLDDARKRQANAEQSVSALSEEGRRNGWR